MSYSTATPYKRRPVRWFWFAVGWVAVAVGSIGVVVPGLPTTVFFIIAAWCFARSSPRFERWILELPKIGPMVLAHRQGLGMPYRAKVWAISTLCLFVGVALWTASDKPLVAAVIAVAALIGVLWIAFKVPTRERVEQQRSGSAKRGQTAG